MLLALLLPILADADEFWFADAQGRHFIPHGFVTITGDATGEVRYTPEDYHKMALLGANFQVIRIFLYKLGGLPGSKLDKKYLEQLDEMVTLGKQAGMRSAFKLTVYALGSSAHAEFSSEDWRDLYLDKDGRQELLLKAWRPLFERYKNEPAVFGYDLLNEPCATRAKKQIWELAPRFHDSQTFLRDYFVPLYRKLIDELHQISPTGKWALYQPYHVPPTVHRQTGFACLPLTVPMERSGIVLAAHFYGQDPLPAVQRYASDAAVSQAPLLFGEYGNATALETDRDPMVQAAYKKVLIETVTEFDRRALGCVKAWWCGSRDFDQALKTNPKSRTWALFYGDSPLGDQERKYIADVIARPRPLVIAGVVKSFHFDFATRSFEMRFIPDASKGESELYVPVERHFPDGFLLLYGGMNLAFAPQTPNGFKVVTNPDKIPVAGFRWDAQRRRVVVSDWGPQTSETTLRIVPNQHE